MKIVAKQKSAKRKVWAAWSNGDNSTRVQINEPALARKFAKLEGVERTGISVVGPYTEIFITNQSIPWVERWLKARTKTLVEATRKGKESCIELMAA